MNIKSKGLGAILVALGIAATSGCSTMSNHQKPVPKYVADEVPSQQVEQTMADAMKTSSKALQVLSQVNNAEKAGKLDYEQIRQANWRATYTPDGMGRKVTITWDGPVEPILRTLGQKVDYNVSFLNNPPAIPPVVHIDVKDKSVIDVLRKIDAQVNNDVDINIFESGHKKKIEVKYAN